MAPRRDWPPGATARLRTLEALDRQMSSFNEDHGIGPVGLARKVNNGYLHGQRVSHQFLSRLRDPQDRSTRSCSPDLARRIAKALGVAPELLFDMPDVSIPVAQIRHPRTSQIGATA